MYCKVHNVKIKDIIKKRKFKNRTFKNVEIINNNKNKIKNKRGKKINIINVDITNNPKINIKKNTEVLNKIVIENKEEKECSLKLNKTMIIKGVYLILENIIKSQLTEKNLNEMLNSFVKYNKTTTFLIKKRICKTPFKKWYIKGYVYKSDYVKIVNNILGFNDEINKNLKLKANNIKIISIKFL